MENESLTRSHRRRAIRDALRSGVSDDRLRHVLLRNLYGVVKKLQKDSPVGAILAARGDPRRLMELRRGAFRHDSLELLIEVLSASDHANPRKALEEYLHEEVARGFDVAARDVASATHGPTLSELAAKKARQLKLLREDLRGLAQKVAEAPDRPVRRPPGLGKSSTEKILKQSLLG